MHAAYTCTHIHPRIHKKTHMHTTRLNQHTRLHKYTHGTHALNTYTHSSMQKTHMNTLDSYVNTHTYTHMYINLHTQYTHLYTNKPLQIAICSFSLIHKHTGTHPYIHTLTQMHISLLIMIRFTIMSFH